MSDDKLLEAIDSGDIHDQLLGYITDGETAEECLGRLLDAHPSFVDRECRECGRSRKPLDDNDWLAWRLKVEDSDRRRTDIYCGPSCLAKSLNAEFEIPITEER